MSFEDDIAIRKFEWMRQEFLRGLWLGGAFMFVLGAFVGVAIFLSI